MANYVDNLGYDRSKGVSATNPRFVTPSGYWYLPPQERSERRREYLDYLAIQPDGNAYAYLICKQSGAGHTGIYVGNESKGEGIGFYAFADTNKSLGLFLVRMALSAVPGYMSMSRALDALEDLDRRKIGNATFGRRAFINLAAASGALLAGTGGMLAGTAAPIPGECSKTQYKGGLKQIKNNSNALGYPVNDAEMEVMLGDMDYYIQHPPLYSVPGFGGVTGENCASFAQLFFEGIGISISNTLNVKLAEIANIPNRYFDAIAGLCNTAASVIQSDEGLKYSLSLQRLGRDMIVVDKTEIEASKAAQLLQERNASETRIKTK